MKKLFFLSASFLFFGSVFAEEIYLECTPQFLSRNSTAWIDGQCVATEPTPSSYLKIIDDYWEQTQRDLNTSDRTNRQLYCKREDADPLSADCYGDQQLCGGTYLSLDDWLLRAQTMGLPSWLAGREEWLESYNSQGTETFINTDGVQYTDTQIRLFWITGKLMRNPERELFASVNRLTGELYMVRPAGYGLYPEPSDICSFISKEQYESTLEDWNNKINEIKRAQQQFVEQRRLF